MLSESSLPPSGVGLLGVSSLFVDSRGRLRLVYSKCAALDQPPPLPPCEVLTRVFGEPSTERALGISTKDAPLAVAAFLPDPDRWFALSSSRAVAVADVPSSPLPSSPLWRAQTIDDQGTSDVPFPAKAYPGIRTECESSGDPPYTCFGRGHRFGSRADSAELLVTSTGAIWAAYLELEADVVTESGSFNDNCPETIVSGGYHRTLVVSRLESGGENVRGRWSLPDGLTSNKGWLPADFLRFETDKGWSGLHGAEIQLIVYAGGESSVPLLRLGIDTD